MHLADMKVGGGEHCAKDHHQQSSLGGGDGGWVKHILLLLGEGSGVCEEADRQGSLHVSCCVCFNLRGPRANASPKPALH